MQFLRLFLAFWIVLISVLPCVDPADSERTSDGVSRAIAEHRDHDRPEDEHQDLCSPFCMCSCCHTNPVPADFQLTLPIDQMASIRCALINPPFDTPVFDIFRPPQG